MFGVLYPMLLRMGIPQESVSALLDDAWVAILGTCLACMVAGE